MTWTLSSHRLAAWVALAAMPGLFAACGTSPGSHFYTLSDTGEQTAPAADAPTAAAAAPRVNPPFMIEVLPVNIPSLVARPEIVTTDADGNVQRHDYDRWASPLADEIGSALSHALTHSLGVIDTYRTPYAPDATVYRITVNVQRFDSRPGVGVDTTAVWSVVRSTDHVILTCRSTVQQTVDSGAAGFAGIAAAHRAVLLRIADQIAAAVRAEQATPVARDDADAASAVHGPSSSGSAKTAAAVQPVTNRALPSALPAMPPGQCS